VTIGGAVNPADCSLDATLRREALEQAGAVIDAIAQVLVLTHQGAAVEHYFLATLVEIDPTQRTGTLSSHAQGEACEVAAVAFTGHGLASIDLRPPELADYLRRHWRDLARMLPH
jgi:8-oxo-dGTP pyrophosphatase MutT (NUDIX family)